MLYMNLCVMYFLHLTEVWHAFSSPPLATSVHLSLSLSLSLSLPHSHSLALSPPPMPLNIGSVGCIWNLRIDIAIEKKKITGCSCSLI
jgi:hypothetical protein